MYGLTNIVKSGSLPFLRTSTALSDAYARSIRTAITTPFHSATSFGHFDTFVALLSTYGTQGVPLWTSKELSVPPILHLAVVSWRCGASFLQKLFDLVGNPPNAELRLALSEFDINHQDAEGNTALILACENAEEDIVRLLISRQGVEVGLRNTHGHDAFHKSVEHCESGVALLLFTHLPTLDIEAADEDGITAFMTACALGHRQVIDYIHAKRPDQWARLIHMTDSKGRTTLMHCLGSPSALGWGKEAIVRMLIENGSDFHARETAEGLTPFLYAIHNRRNGWHGGGMTNFITHILKPLLVYDPSVFDQRDGQGRTALMLALRNFRPDETLLQFLISSHPIPEQYLNVRDNDGHSALMHIIGRSVFHDGNFRVKAVKTLLANPALDICLRDPMGRGILEVTCSTKSLFAHIDYRTIDSFFPILDAVLRAKDGWDISLVRKAVITAVRKMHDLAVYRLLLEDWVTHSFAWSQEDTETVTLLAQAMTRRSSCQCRAPVSVILYRLGFLEPSLLVDGINIANHRELTGTFCRNQGRRDCKWHSDWGIEELLPRLILNRRSYTPDELERMIPRTQPR